MSFETDASVQTAIGLLFVAFGLALLVVGFLLYKFKFLDSPRFSASRVIGAALMAVGGLLLILSAIGLIYVAISL